MSHWRGYVEDFGKADYWCLVVEIKEKIVGAAWVRILGLPFIDICTLTE